MRSETPYEKSPPVGGPAEVPDKDAGSMINISQLAKHAGVTVRAVPMGSTRINGPTPRRATAARPRPR